jgi:hypothetical protein
LSNKLRGRRFARFEQLIASLPKPVRVLDIGGTNRYWETRDYAGRVDVQITTVNLRPEPQVHGNIVPLRGDATALGQFSGEEFDVVFSNSTIEHLFTPAAQAAMAAEIRRLAPAYYVQTPNYWFPIEPHFLFPGWHWLPEGLRVAMVRRRRIGHRGPAEDVIQARALVREIRLLTLRELLVLFPDGQIVKERVGPLVKSFVAVRERVDL